LQEYGDDPSEIARDPRIDSPVDPAEVKAFVVAEQTKTMGAQRALAKAALRAYWAIAC
jgi:hypothetical protein